MEASNDEPRKIEESEVIKVEESAGLKVDESAEAKVEVPEVVKEEVASSERQRDESPIASPVDSQSRDGDQSNVEKPAEVKAAEESAEAKVEASEVLEEEAGSSDVQRDEAPIASPVDNQSRDGDQSNVEKSAEVKAEESEEVKAEEPEADKDEVDSSNLQREEAQIASPVVNRSRDGDLSNDESLNSPSNMKAAVARPNGFDSRGRKILNHPDPKKNPVVLAREQELRKRMATYRAIAEKKEAAAMEARKLAADEAKRVRNPMQPDLSPRASSGGLLDKISSRPSSSQGSVLDYPGPGDSPATSTTFPRAKSPRPPGSPLGFSIPAEVTQGLAPGVARRIGELENMKLEAVKAEDYAQAFKLKKKITALKEAAFSSVDLLGGPMGLSPGNHQSPNSSSASVSRTRNLSLSPRANKFVQEKLAAKSPVKQDNSPEEIERIKALFQAACTRYKSQDLSKTAFKQLVKQLIKSTGEKTLPSDADLEVTFTLADEDGNGVVDEEEFLHIYELVKNGEVKGLSGNTLTKTSLRQKAILEKKQEKFKKALADAKARGVEYRRNSVEIAEAVEADHRERSQIMEMQRRSEGYHGREMISDALVSAHHIFERRIAKSHTTQALDVGHLANPTAASQHHRDKKQLSRIEQDLKDQKEDRENMSKELEKARIDFQKRIALQKKLGQHNTIADNIGHLGTATVASSHQHDAYDADHVGEGELIQHARVHARDEMGAELTSQKAAWEKRQAAGKLHTDTDKLGHFATGTVASSHQHDAYDADHVGEGELIAHSRQHEREELGAELTKQKAAWEKRQAAGKLHTDADKLGHFATGTVASSHQHDAYDADHVGEGELIAHSRLHEREELGAELTKQKAAWEKRQAAGKLHTDADKLGHFATETTASSHHHDALDADHTSASEFASHSRLHEREELGAAALKEKRAWEKRQNAGKLHTEADKLGHFAVGTSASAHHHDESAAYDAEHVPEGEYIAHAQLHEREDMGAAALKEKEAWMKRQKAGKLHTEAAKLGHFVQETEATKHHHDEDKVPEGNHFGKDFEKDRAELDEENLKQKAIFEKRKKEGKLETKAE